MEGELRKKNLLYSLDADTQSSERLTERKKSVDETQPQITNETPQNPTTAIQAGQSIQVNEKINEPSKKQSNVETEVNQDKIVEKDMDQEKQQAQAAEDEKAQDNEADATVSEDSDHENQKQKPLDINVQSFSA